MMEARQEKTDQMSSFQLIFSQDVPKDAVQLMFSQMDS